MTFISQTSNATAINDVWTITIGGTWVAGDKITTTGNGKSLVTTIGSVVTVAGVAITLSQSFNSTNFTDTTATQSPALGGTSIPEFREGSTYYTATTVVIVGNTAGNKLCTFTVTKTSASGTVSITNTIAATGPSDWTNTANWSTGTVPVTGDDVLLDRPISMLDNLAQSAVTLASLTYGPRFTLPAVVGRPSRNPNGYEEFRSTELAIGVTNLTVNCGSGLIRMNLGSVACTATVYASGASTDAGRQAIQLQGTNAANSLNITGPTTLNSTAYVSWAENGDTATLATLRQDTGTMVIGQPGVGTVTLTTVTKNGGELYLCCGATTVTNSGNLYHYAGAITTATHYANTWTDLTTATYTTMTTHGVYNADGAVGAKTITNLNLVAPGSVVNTSGRLTVTNLTTLRGTLSIA